MDAPSETTGVMQEDRSPELGPGCLVSRWAHSGIPHTRHQFYFVAEPRLAEIFLLGKAPRGRPQAPGHFPLAQGEVWFTGWGREPTAVEMGIRLVGVR